MTPRASRPDLARWSGPLPLSVALTARQIDVLRLAERGLSGKQIARRLGISARTVEDHFAALRHSTGTRSLGELIAYATAAGLAQARPPDPSRGGVAPASGNSIRIGYARVSARAQDHRAQLAALAAAHCHKVVIETADSPGARPQLLRALEMLGSGDTLVIHTPDRVAGSFKELLVLLEDQLRARGINLDILAGICAGLHCPGGPAVTGNMLFMVAAMAAEMERDLLRERTPDGQRPPQA